jgi:UDP-N-acetylglucosamine 2-epimerase (non-hydrolysing)/GDP/UDP-N,N'-diacetylbacillosamine 2-epimerase (hydrolysing)
MNKRAICVVTGSRADYGLLYWLLKDLQADPDLHLQLAVTGMHLSPDFGETYREIEADGFTVHAKVETLLSTDTPFGLIKSVGLGLIGFADAFQTLRPDLVVLLGDRYEIFAAAQAALFARIPIAHIAGGDTTEGSFDEAIRHSITKMAVLHFATNEVAARRIRQLGEDSAHIFNVGSPGIDCIKRQNFLTREELKRRLGFSFRITNILITFHPATLEAESASTQFGEVCKALDQFPQEDFGLLFTKPNSDTGSRLLIHMMDKFVESHPNAKAFTSLGQELYLSLLAQVDLVLGNSSSGLYEAPSFHKPTVNIGQRQKGRLQASSVINCGPVAADIVRAIREALAMDCSQTANPYGDGCSTPRILSKLKDISDPRELLKKHFFDLN